MEQFNLQEINALLGSVDNVYRSLVLQGYYVPN